MGALYFFVVDLLATKWEAWQYDYAKTMGTFLEKSVIEDLTWTIMVFMTLALVIEIFFEKQKNK